MSRTYLKTTYNEREQVKRLGAKWDADQRSWYVPEGASLVPFQHWLPAASAGLDQQALVVSEELLPAKPQGVSLSQLLQGVSNVVASAFPEGVWVRVEVTALQLRGHVYLELSERSGGGVLAKARGMIWQQVANRILPEFQAATGMQLAEGIKLLVRAKPSMHAQYGLSLVIDAIDPQYTLGDLEARKREIRARLKQEGAWDANRELPTPWDFNDVLVVAPEAAAGLGDFRAEADRLHAAGLCRFTYATSRFQGEDAPAEICAAAGAALQSWTEQGCAPDVIVIIRGGGAVGDLAWLNDYCLARFICDAPVPVFTGIGHERDSTVLDEVAHTRFDTPSKVIAGIEALIAQRANEARVFFDAIAGIAHRRTLAAGAAVERAMQVTRHESAKQPVAARHQVQQDMSSLRHGAMQTVRSAADQTSLLQAGIRQEAVEALAAARAEAPLLLEQVQSSAQAAVRRASALSRAGVQAVTDRAAERAARQRERVERSYAEAAGAARAGLAVARRQVPDLMQQVRDAARGQVATVRQTVHGVVSANLERTGVEVRRARDVVGRELADLRGSAGTAVAQARQASQALVREVTGQGPEKTLRRGFAVVRDKSDRPVTTAAQAKTSAALAIQFQDGTVPVRAEEQKT